MGRTVRELLQSMDAVEFRQWLALYERDPWTEDRSDLRAGIIAATVANANSTKRRFKPSDFVPDYERRRRKAMTPDQLRDMALRINAMMGGSVQTAARHE